MRTIWVKDDTYYFPKDGHLYIKMIHLLVRQRREFPQRGFFPFFFFFLRHPFHFWVFWEAGSKTSLNVKIFIGRQVLKGTAGMDKVTHAKVGRKGGKLGLKCFIHSTTLRKGQSGNEGVPEQRLPVRGVLDRQEGSVRQWGRSRAKIAC